MTKAKQPKEKKLYSFEGAVYMFERPYCSRWKGKTIAVSPEKARSNLAYQFRKAYGLNTQTPIDLIGPLKTEAVLS